MKLPEIALIWATKNLFFTCVSEEALFRGFLQRHLSENLKQYRYGDALSLIAASLVFGLAHFVGGFKYIVLAAMAGIAYGYAYQKTQRIEASILCHFGVNTVHFLLLAYPALASTQPTLG